MRYRLPALCLLLACSVASAADPAIRLPVAPVPPQPMPQPVEPGGVLRLTPDMLAVIDADVPVRVLAVPRGLVKVTKEVGPLRVRGQFVDGVPGKAETRTYTGKSVWVIEAVGTGRVDVLVVPEGPAKPDDSDVQTLSLDVSGGTGPIPPPTPKVEPKPDAPIPVAGLRVLIVYESADLAKMPPAQNGIIFGAKVRDHLNAACAVGPDGKTREFRIWDADVATAGESKTWQDAMKRPRASVPWLLVSNGVTGYEGPLPADADAFLALLKKYEGK